MPVSLSYHASGVKVAEPASWVGLGWNLNAGGMISRTIQGVADDAGGIGYFINPPTLSCTDESYLWSDGAAGTLDFEPDIFNYSFGGYSGKFYFDNNQICRFLPIADITLQHYSSANTFEGFILTTPDGTRWHFGKTDLPTTRTAYDYLQSTNEAFERKTTWHLLRVETYDLKFSINLYYSAAEYGYRSPASCKEVITPAGCLGGASPGQFCSSDASLDLYHHYIKTNFKGKHIQKITTSTNIIEFAATTDRQDLDINDFAGSIKKSLDEIKLYTLDAQGNINNNYCSNYQFSYSYWQDPSNTGSESKRLKLTQVQRKSCDGSTIVEPPYIFTYEAGDLPYRLSKQVDHWGHFNGQSQNETKLVNISPTTISGITVGSSNRNSSQAHMKRGALKEITYPTAGKTIFDYEANRMLLLNTSTTNERLSLKSCTTSISSCCGEKTNQSADISFTAAELNDTKYQIKLWRIPNVSGQNCSGATMVDAEVQAFNATTGNPAAPYVVTLNLGLNEQYAETVLTNISPSLITSPVAGQLYYFRITTTDGYGELRIVSTTYSNQNQIVGGLRIKEIRNHDGISSGNDVVKRFEYTNENDTLSSAKYLEYFPGNLRYGFIAREGVLVFTDEQIVPLGTLGHGMHLGYERVKEIAVGSPDPQGNGITIFRHTWSVTSQSPVCGAPSQYPVVPLHTNPLTGSPIEVNKGPIVESTTYETPSSTLSSGHIFKIAPPIGCLGLPNQQFIPALVIEYNIRQYSPVRPQSATITKDGVTTITTYSYDPQNRFFAPTATQITNSDGKIFKTKTQYAHDIAWTCLKDDMLNRNIVGVPIKSETEVTQNSTTTTVSGDRTDFAFFGTNGLPVSTGCPGGIPYPHKFYKYEVAIDANGNPLGTGTWSEEGVIKERHAATGLPKKFMLKGWEDELYDWETNGLIKLRRYADFIWNYEYHPGTRLLKKITDIDGQFVEFNYDKLMRLKESIARGGKIKTLYTYNYGLPQEWQGGNWVRTQIDYNGFPDQDTKSYFDGLGRSLDTWRFGYGPGQEDIVAERLYYDNRGRVDRKVYLPGLQSELSYTRYEYEPSPLNRVWKEFYPDNNFVETTYGSEGQYYKLTVKDENAHTSSSLTDIIGRKTSVAGEMGTLTQFQYDNKNNLLKVINPELQEYLYTYDAGNRLMHKTVPGAGTQDFYYEERDLLIASRDGNLSLDEYGAVQNKWLATEYDVYGRVIRTGFGTSSPAVSFPPGGGYLTNPVFAINDDLILNTYDVATLDCESAYAPKGKLTQASARVLEADGSLGAMLATQYCYDEYGRVKRTIVPHYGSGDDIRNAYDIADHVTHSTRGHDGTDILVNEHFSYDHSGRLFHQNHLLEAATYAPNPGIEQLTYLGYNTKDQLTDKSLGGLAGLGYGYNSRGWLESINNMPFPETLRTPTCEVPMPPVPDPGGPVKSCGECGDDLMSLAQILQARQHNELKVDCYIPCDCGKRCDPTGVEPCPDGGGTGGGEGAATVGGMQFPNNLFRILKCDGEDAHVVQDSLPQVGEVYAMQERIPLEHDGQQFRVVFNGLEAITDLSHLLAMAGSGGDLEVKSEKESAPCGECTEEAPVCQDGSEQQTSLATIAANMGATADNLEYPVNLIRIRLCNGDEIYLLEPELEQLPGNYFILQTIPIENSSQLLAIGDDGFHMTFHGYLRTRTIDPRLNINYYQPCTENECGVVDERHNARSIGESTIFSAFDNQPPYYDLTAVHPDADKSLVYDFQTWDIVTSELNSNGEAEWDVRVNLPPDVTLKFYEAYVIIPNMRTYNSRIGLYDGTGFVKINGGKDFELLNGQSFPQMPFLVLKPDVLPTLQQAGNMKIAIFIGTGSIRIDAAYVILDYLQPCDRCDQTGPDCTQQESAAQQASLDTILSQTPSQIMAKVSFPTKLYRVRLCDQSEIYLLQHEVEQLAGNYIILQSVSIGKSGQTFLTTVGVPNTPSSGGAPGARHDLFAQKLKYYTNDPQIAPGFKGYKNGNIAVQYWQVAGRDRQAYAYDYDNLDRLEWAIYSDIDKNNHYYNHGIYNEQIDDYDKIGNIKRLNRWGVTAECDNHGSILYEFGQIDALTYDYNGDRSRLVNINDGSGNPHGFVPQVSSYDYDNNGNMNSDDGKQITIAYNHLNLPREIIRPWESEEQPGGILRFVYDATGRKLKKTLYAAGSSIELSSTLYEGGIEKESKVLPDNSIASAIFVYHAEGRVALYWPSPTEYEFIAPNAPRWEYEYTLRDHLGNSRVTISDKNNDGYIQASGGDWSAGPIDFNYTEILQENHFYPFGLTMEGAWREPELPRKENEYGYNGKELNEELGLGWLDYGARGYNPAIARWGQVDQLASSYFSFSPYTYVGNMPTKAVDPDGNKIVVVSNENYGQVLIDLAKIYATRRGRAIIDRLAASEEIYTIDGSANSINGSLFWGTRYNNLTENLTYTQNMTSVDDVISVSFVILSHELFHAYQDDTKAKSNYPKQKEADAMMFENYMRDVYGLGKHRTKHGGSIHLTGVTALDSNGERVDASSVKISAIMFGQHDDGADDSDKNSQKKDNTKDVLNTQWISHLVEYMNSNGIQKLYLNLDQR